MGSKAGKGLLAAIALALSLTACFGQGGGGGTPSMPAAADRTPPDPFGKYDPPIEVTTIRNVSEVVENNVLGALPGETVEDNRWSRLYADTLGIRLKYDWVVKASPESESYLQLLNVTLASGHLPDFIPVNAIQLKQLVDAGQVEDLTALYEQYASPMTKDVLSQDGDSPFEAATFGGKLMAIPEVVSSQEHAMFLWVRTDWLNKLGLQPPKTMADVRAIAQAFAERDPDGNGKRDTYGLALSRELWSGAMGLEGFMAGYGAYPNLWIEDGRGRLAYGGTQPEVRRALQALQDMMADGVLDPEFGIKDGDKVAEDIAAGRIGLAYGEQWNSIWPLQLNKNADSKAQWQAYPIVSASGEPPEVPLRFGTTKFFAVRKGAAHPEAVIKLFNLHLEKNWGATAEFDRYYAPPEAESVWQLSPVQPSPPKKNLAAFHQIEAARRSGDKSALQGEAKTIQDKLDMYASGSTEGFALWGWERIYGPEGAMAVLDRYERGAQFLNDKFYGAPTPTMVERQSTLEKIQNETFIRIIMGEPIEQFDKYVTDWKQLGGDRITQELNEWYASKS